MAETVTVTQLNSRVKTILGNSPAVRDLWVNGEISNLKKYPSGHYYFTLKDSGSEIRAVLFAHSRQRMEFEPKENMKVSAFGSVDMYVQRGAYQFVVENMRPAGLGDLYLAFEALSEKGAVIHDIITTSGSRFPADILLAPALVQGEGAARSIVDGIELLNRVGVDVLIVGRGGGSLEDLWAFNEEPVARAIASSKAPVVSAVGHETDFTIADFVADVRAPTPTGAAAIILRDRVEILNQLNTDMARASRALSASLDRMNHRFEVLDARLSPEKALDDLSMRLMSVDDLSNRGENALRTQVSEMRRRFEVVNAKLSPAAGLSRMETLSERCSSLYSRAEASVGRRFDTAASRLESLSGRLESLNPLNVLSRGYGLITDSEGRAVTSVDGVATGDRVTINLRDGSASARIEEKVRK